MIGAYIWRVWYDQTKLDIELLIAICSNNIDVIDFSNWRMNKCWRRFQLHDFFLNIGLLVRYFSWIELLDTDSYKALKTYTKDVCWRLWCIANLLSVLLICLIVIVSWVTFYKHGLDLHELLVILWKCIKCALKT